MRIVIDALSARQGGGQTYLINLLRHLPDDDDLRIFLLLSDELSLAIADSRVQKIETLWPTRNPFVRTAFQRVWLPRLIRRLKAEAIFWPGGVVPAKVPAGCAVITMFRNMIPFDREQRGRYPLGYMRIRNWLLERVMLRSMLKADLVIFISEHAKKVIEARASGQLKKCKVIPHGVAKEFFGVEHVDYSEVTGHEGAESYFLYVSSIDFYKAHVEVVRAYALLKRIRPETREKLIFIGPENPHYGRQVRQEVARLGLQDEVLILGPVRYADLPQFYRNASVSIFASESENCPNVLLEALAAGRPVLCSKMQPMPEFGGNAPIYFDPKNPEELAQRLHSILDDHVRMRRLGVEAARQAERYDWRKTAQATWTEIADLVEARRP